MSKSKKQRETERAEALDNIRDALKACGPDGDSTLLIVDDGGRPSSSGRTHRLQVHVIEPTHTVGRPVGCRSVTRPRTTFFLSINAARVLGYRLAKDESILMGGYGYSRSLEIAQGLARACGHALHVDSLGDSFGARGWVMP